MTKPIWISKQRGFTQQSSVDMTYALRNLQCYHGVWLDRRKPANLVVGISSWYSYILTMHETSGLLDIYNLLLNKLPIK